MGHEPGIYNADISPDDSFFVVTSGSGGDAPPISDTAVAYPLTAASLQDSDVQPLWISRHFDSIYSVAITEVAVYLGGHFGFIESPTSDDPWPGLARRLRHRTGSRRLRLGDQVVRRDHIAAVSPVTGKALEWETMGGSNSFEGDKAMEATPRGCSRGDAAYQGRRAPGRVAFFDQQRPVPGTLPDTTGDADRGSGRREQRALQITGTARVATGQVGRVQVQIRPRQQAVAPGRGTAFDDLQQRSNSLNATLTRHRHDPTWSIPATIATNPTCNVRADVHCPDGWHR